MNGYSHLRQQKLEEYYDIGTLVNRCLSFRKQAMNVNLHLGIMECTPICSVLTLTVKNGW